MHLKSPLKVKWKLILVMKMYFYFHNAIFHMKSNFKECICEFRQDTKKKDYNKSL